MAVETIGPPARNSGRWGAELCLRPRNPLRVRPQKRWPPGFGDSGTPPRHPSGDPGEKGTPGERTDTSVAQVSGPLMAAWGGD